MTLFAFNWAYILKMKLMSDDKILQTAFNQINTHFSDHSVSESQLFELLMAEISRRKLEHTLSNLFLGDLMDHIL